MPTPQNKSDAIALGKQNAADITARRQAALTRRAASLAKLPKAAAAEAPLQPKDLVALPKAVEPAAQPAAVTTAGYLLAVGDSWFDYPLHDVLTELEEDPGYTIQSTARAGDPIESMAYTPGGQLNNVPAKLDSITGQGAVPKAVLLSGGGDDIAGKEFGMLLNSAYSKISGWAPDIINYLVNERILLAYQTIITTVTELCKPSVGGNIPILVHGYDYPVPDGRGFGDLIGISLLGPWLRPGFNEKLFDDLPTNIAFMHTFIDQFNTMLAGLAADPAFANVVYVNLRNTLSTDLTNNAYQQFWANELHPTQQGFTAVAQKFAAHL
jgi:hypothetical protein